MKMIFKYFGRCRKFRSGIFVHTTAVFVFTYIFILAVIATFAVNETYRKNIRRTQIRTVQYSQQVKEQDEKRPLNRIQETTENTLHLKSDGIPPIFKVGTFPFITSGSEGHSFTVYGRPRKDKGFLTIGIPTIRRPDVGTRYLIDTVNSILNNTNISDLKTLTVIISVCDFNQTWNTVTANMLYSRFKKHSESGLIQIVQPFGHMYPKFKHNDFKRSKDKNDKSVWRSKQNIDFAFLMLCSRPFSEYYMQLDDDVITENQYLKDIKFVIEDRKKKHQSWKILDFSKQGFIGKLFRSTMADKIAYFFLSFYDELPGASLYKHVVHLFEEKEHIYHTFNLFHHQSKIPFQENVDQSLAKAISKGDNPPAIIRTDMKTYKQYLPENAYLNKTLFWAVDVDQGQSYQIVFLKPQNISRIVIKTGDRQTKRDKLEFGGLSLSYNKHCKNLLSLSEFIDGQVDTATTNALLPCNIHCLSINIYKSQRQWLKLNMISIFLSRKNYCLRDRSHV